ncbi:MAG TPA: Clp protease N-terminal domain-containing protein [Dehalococcoidia bacterium]|nr:Clp protease N-terminal domain-containing protein [Dehalococcoidia bacterium]
MTATDGPGYLTWGHAAARLLRTARLEASRSGHSDVLPAHLLLAALDQPELHQALRVLGAAPDVYGIRARLAAASLRPSEFSEALPLSPSAAEALESAREHREGEAFELLFLLVLKATLEDEACRVLLHRAGTDPEALALLLARVD